ncbi:MAG: hypothetical protein JW395_2083 [Nitrospira sp.]|nr:hypothetical protein [Nitrospira sp.]
MKANSFVMSVAGALGLRRLSWSLRRLHCPVSRSALVLEVGSGGNPYPRANVLLDAYEETRERHWDPLVCDRPTVLATAERLPFKDKAFDFVIASHVLEHSAEPALFLDELQRVARAGYLETPDALMERINPYKDHRLEVTVRGEELVIRKKPHWVVDDGLVELYEQRAKRIVTRTLIPGHPDYFHVRFYWDGEIRYRVTNPSVDASWEPDIGTGPGVAATRGVKAQARHVFLSSIRWLFSQRARNRELDLLPLLRCPSCGMSQFLAQGGHVTCERCSASYPLRNNLLVMNAAGAK